MTTREDALTTGYAGAAAAWTAAGWQGVLPLPHRSKTPPPAGYTGQAGKWPDPATIDAWAALGAPNACLRLPDGVVGIDIDAYDARPGGDTLHRLEQQHGPLPDTWIVTSRADGTSGIRLYRVPTGIRWRGEAGPGIDIIQHRHRYALIPPSIHPEGREYLLIGPGGELHTTPPAPTDLPQLPTRWIAALREPEPTPPPPPRQTQRDLGPLDRWKQRATTDDIRTMLDALGAHNWRPVGELWHCTRPGKPDGTSAVVGLGPGGTPGNVTHVHTTNWPGLPPGTHTASDLLTILHGGPAAAAAAILDAEGWRPPSDTSWISQHVPIGTRTPPQPDPDRDDWAPIPLAPIATATLAGTLTVELPTVLHVEGLLPLLYRGRVNLLFGESGGGKTWVALQAVAETIKEGGKAAFIDYEDRPEGIVGRLLALGCTPEQCGNVTYFAPVTGLAVGIETLEKQLNGHELVVIDSTGEAMAAGGVKGNDDDDVARWVRLAKRIAALASAPAVLLLDHVPKAADAPTLHAIGSQRKRAAVTGAAYRVDTLKEPAKGRPGTLKLVVAKDRLGNRPKGATAAIVDIDGSADGTTIRIRLHATDAQAAAAAGQPLRPTTLMSRVSDHLSQHGPDTINNICAALGGRKQGVLQAIERLVAEGWCTAHDLSGKAREIRLVTPFRAGDMPPEPGGSRWFPVVPGWFPEPLGNRDGWFPPAGPPPTGGAGREPPGPGGENHTQTTDRFPEPDEPAEEHW
jgi:hypothetical protein